MIWTLVAFLRPSSRALSAYLVPNLVNTIPKDRFRK